jgi:hypothetical protein
MHDDHFSIPNAKQADSVMHAKINGSLIAKPGNEILVTPRARLSVNAFRGTRAVLQHANK